MKVPHASKTLPASRSVLLRGDACILPEPPATFPQNSKPTVGDVKPQAPNPGTESDREAVARALVDPSNQQNLFANDNDTASTFPIGQDNTVGEGACEGANPDVCGCASVYQMDYRGPINITADGIPCIAWDKLEWEWYISRHYPDSGLKGNNACRNPPGPGRSLRPFCYTGLDGNTAPCDVPVCKKSLASASPPPSRLPGASLQQGSNQSITSLPPTHACVANRMMLIVAVRQYMDQGCADNASCLIALKHGWPMNSWCVSSITSLQNVFENLPTFNEEISSWDVSSLTDMSATFKGATAFSKDLSDWNVSGVKDMEQTFNYADSFNGQISSWDVSSVTDMQDMFWGAAALNQDLSSWDVSQLKYMGWMFEDAISFNQDLCSWADKFNTWPNKDDMFAGSGCIFQYSPDPYKKGPFCASHCQGTTTAWSLVSYSCQMS